MWFLGQAQDEAGGTGCTVALFPQGATAGVDVRGGAPGTRETALLDPSCLVDRVQALVMTGGSAYGLAAADGVMRYCEEHCWGFDVGVGIVPIVTGACLFDLQVGDPASRPDASMGYAACTAATLPHLSPQGNVGAGMGATVGKFLTPDRCMKSGFGWAFRKEGPYEAFAFTVVNALGNVRGEDGVFIAGARDLDGGIVDPNEGLFEANSPFWSGAQTTLAAVVLNASLDKASCRRVAFMLHDALAETIFPVHTPYDGDTTYCLAQGELEAPLLLWGILGQKATSEAIRNAVRYAKSAFGCPGLGDLR